MTFEEKQEFRELIVLKARSLDLFEISNAEFLDKLVCDALEIDNDDPPPHFIIDSLHYS